MVLHAYSRSRTMRSNGSPYESLKEKKIRTCIRGRHEFDSLHSPVSPRLRRPQGIIRHDVYATHTIFWTSLRGASRGLRVISQRAWSNHSGAIRGNKGEDEQIQVLPRGGSEFVVSCRSSAAIPLIRLKERGDCALLRRR